MSLVVEDLSISIDGNKVVDRVSFAVAGTERIALIGESGSGKTMTALAVLGLLPSRAQVTGSVRWHGRELHGLSEKDRARVRGKEMGIVFQEPATALNPVRTIGSQIVESVKIHYHRPRAELRERAIELCRRVRLPDPENIVDRYPHQLSGGQRQRVAIAMALATGPRLIVADEPTTALDVTVQQAVLDLLVELTSESGAALVFITHDLALLPLVAERGYVMADGRVVEDGSVMDLLMSSRHEVTQSLSSAARETSWSVVQVPERIS